MIYLIMMFVLGFFCASLISLLMMPVFIRRAARKYEKMKHVITPKNLLQARADQDMLRAEYAIATRKLEKSVEILKARGRDNLVEIAHRNSRIERMKKEVQKVSSLADRRQKDRNELLHQLTSIKQNNLRNRQSYLSEHGKNDLMAEEFESGARLLEEANATMNALQTEIDNANAQSQSVETDQTGTPYPANDDSVPPARLRKKGSSSKNIAHLINLPKRKKKTAKPRLPGISANAPEQPKMRIAKTEATAKSKPGLAGRIKGLKDKGSD